jgi:hypothetical protein
MRVVLATRNAGKVREFDDLLGDLAGGVTFVPLDASAPEPDETGATFLENALLKARSAAAATGRPALADDSGLCVDALGERQIVVDCDVLQADGGTRTAAITGGYVALVLALHRIAPKASFPRPPLLAPVAAISVGRLGGEAALDLDYDEDSNAEVDMNVVGLEGGKLIEVQGTAEGRPFTRAQLDAMLALGEAGIATIVKEMRAVVG